MLAAATAGVALYWSIGSVRAIISARRPLSQTGAPVSEPATVEQQRPVDPMLASPEPEDRVTEANFHRIEKGMTRPEVEAILGPPGDYSTGPLNFGPRVSMLFSNHGPHPTDAYKPSYWDGVDDVVEWRTDKQMIMIYFSPSGPLRKCCYDVVLASQWTP
jgi:hypothetical protein